LNNATVHTDGSITPPDVETTVNLVLEVTRLATGTKANTVSIEVIVPEKSNPTEVVNGIMAITAPAIDDIHFTLPTVPAGYTVKIKSSDNTSIIDTNGAIITPDNDTTVNLVFVVTRISDGTTADTASIPVNVPARSKSRRKIVSSSVASA
jgi:hypothetical protein